MFTHKYPGTNLYELNLDWVLNTVKSLKEQVAEFSEVFETFTEEFETFKEDFNGILDDISGLQTTVSNIELSIAAINDDIDHLTDTINGVAAGAKEYTDEQISMERTARQTTDTLLSGRIDNLSAQTDNAVDNLQQQIDDLAFTLPDVNNLVTGAPSSIQQYIDDVYNQLRYNALTVDEYTALSLTNAQYAAYQLTNEQYAIAGKLLLV